jgi:hypothetical protein
MIRGGRTHRNWNQRASPDRATVTAWGGATQTGMDPGKGLIKPWEGRGPHCYSLLNFTHSG